MFTKLHFGTAGSPLSSPARSFLDGIKQVRKLNLEAMELEFVRQVYIKEENASEVKKTAEENNVVLTCHGQYYINLNSLEKKKQEESIERIYKAAKIASLCGAKSVTFHAGFFNGKTEEETYKTIRMNLLEVKNRLESENHKIMLRPETTGKPSQFGSLQQLIRLSKDIDILPCVDFAHLHAREGKMNTFNEFHSTLALLEKELDCLKNMHIHMAGINYTEKGERNHLNLEDSDFNWKELLKAWKEFNIKGVVISESPNIEEDALLMQGYYETYETDRTTEGIGKT